MKFEQHAIIKAHAGAIGIEDANDACIDAVSTVVRHCEGFREAFGFIVYRAHSYWVTMTPVGLFLWMFNRISVNLTGGGKQEAGFMRAGHTQCIVCA
jgi:hypothetical protein